MALKLLIVSGGDEPLPPGSPLRVELRDTSFADAPAMVLKRIDTKIPAKGRTTSLTVSIDADVPDGTTIWAHNDVDGDGRVSAGDFITMESYPVTASTQGTTIRLKKVT